MTQMAKGPLQLKGCPAKVLRPRRGLPAQGPFPGLGEGHGVGHGLAPRPLHQKERGLSPFARHQGKQAPVLVTQADLQVHDPLAQNAKPEVPGFDDPCMHGSHRHLVEEGKLPEGVGKVVTPEGFQPGVPHRLKTPLPKGPFKPIQSGKLGGQAGKAPPLTQEEGFGEA